ncbi:MAG TPA: phosphatidylserine decarboxylase [Parachlamydiaceae bacterium]|nr:phosphatidylserine decarboxylase [Parachlamydiaceae bacterium]
MKENLHQITYIDRTLKKKCVEKVYGGSALKLLYGDDFISKILGAPLLHALVKYPIFSKIYGWFQKTSSSQKKIKSFIQNFEVDSSEFLLDVDDFQSFNDFFIRKLKLAARPITAGENVAIIPADGRYLFYQNIRETDGFIVKGEKFNLDTLLDDPALASQYDGGSMVIARLCPTDYHRYHFPVDCTPSKAKIINGWLYSVNPIAIKKNIHIFTQNKRALTELKTEKFGTLLFLEIGATSVGTITDTYIPDQFYPKGAEKGYFSFGASSLILLFEPGKITFDEDLLLATKEGFEIRCLMGQKMGTLHIS